MVSRVTCAVSHSPRCSYRSGRSGSNPLHVEVLVVGHGVGNAPGHALVVPEVGKARAAREGKTDNVELGAGHVVLVVDVGHVKTPVRIARDQRGPRRRPFGTEGPAVGAGVGLGERCDRISKLGEDRFPVSVVARVRLSRRDD